MTKEDTGVVWPNGASIKQYLHEDRIQMNKLLYLSGNGGLGNKTGMSLAAEAGSVWDKNWE